MPTYTQAHEAKVHTWLIPSLPPDTKLRQVQQNTDMLVQISGGTHPHIVDDLLVPKARKEVFHPAFSGLGGPKEGGSAT